MDGIITYVDEYFLRAKAEMPYPCIVIESKDVEALPLVMEALEDGDVAVVFEYQEKFNIVKKRISNSALNLSKLLAVFKFTVVISREEQYKIRNKADLLEVGDWKRS